ncbi:M28 family peptidase [Terricaulis sp.]|uniref:M28 family peptidase n=1 Tax=Terricaulis sp. TaxID=2768686 RepID=UPI003783D7D8
MKFGRTIVAAGVLLSLGACASVSPAHDAETAAWWRTTAALSGDDMEGRDTGSAGYDRAAAYVAERFRGAGLAPAGDGDTYFQRLNLHDVEVINEGTSFTVTHANGAVRALRFLHEISVTPTQDMAPHIAGPLVFRGYCAAADMTDVRGAVVVCFGARRPGQTTSASRLEAATAAGAIAVVNVDDPGFTVEPARWPLAYARSVAVTGLSELPRSIPVMRMSAQAFGEMTSLDGADGAAVLARGARGEPMQSFDLHATLDARVATRTRSYTSDNVLAVLPGTDPALAHEPVLLIAHLDGYGYGTPVDGDDLYNGALDDAAYVATLITLADERHGRGFRRPLIFAAVTGEEKGLLGSRWLAAHPTQGAPPPIAVLNLDQLRPLYPLTILTTLGLDDSTLGQTVRSIAEPMGIQVRRDLEPERGLLRRTDHWPFMQRGVPSVSFLFGVDPGTEAHARYIDWYQRRYHAPQDDLATPIDFDAQAKFHRFYFALVEAVANADAPPQWLPDSPNRPTQ